jgi:hypothetical protein
MKVHDPFTGGVVEHYCASTEIMPTEQCRAEQVASVFLRSARTTGAAASVDFESRFRYSPRLSEGGASCG